VDGHDYILPRRNKHVTRTARSGFNDGDIIALDLTSSARSRLTTLTEHGEGVCHDRIRTVGLITNGCDEPLPHRDCEPISRPRLYRRSHQSLPHPPTDQTQTTPKPTAAPWPNPPNARFKLAYATYVVWRSSEVIH
jgi:hypothetical protein